MKNGTNRVQFQKETWSGYTQVHLEKNPITSSRLGLVYIIERFSSSLISVHFEIIHFLSFLISSDNLSISRRISARNINIDYGFEHLYLINEFTMGISPPLQIIIQFLESEEEKYFQKGQTYFQK